MAFSLEPDFETGQGLRTGVPTSSSAVAGFAGINSSALALVDLPPLPAVAIKALRMVSNHEARLRDLHTLLAADTAFSVEILKLVNSPLYGIRVEISSVMQAMMLLGFERIRGLILTIGMRAFVGGALNVSGIRTCWRHSLATALLAEEVAAATHLDKDVAYTAGLMHDLGRLAMVVLRPQQYANLIEASRELPCDPLQEERRIFGTDHCEAGRSLVLAWKLPGPFIEMASAHHDREPEGKSNFDMLSVVRLSCALSEAIGFEVIRSNIRRTYAELVAAMPAAGRERFPREAEELTQLITAKVDSLEAT